MEAAATAARRGHTVTLKEKTCQLGGLMVLGEIFNPELTGLKKYLVQRLKNSEVDIELKCEVTGDDIRKIKSDIVVIATGGVSKQTELPNHINDTVIKLADVLSALNGKLTQGDKIGRKIMWRLASYIFKYIHHPQLMRSLLRIPFPVGKKLILLGGGFASAELALAYSQKGRLVTIVDESSDLFADLGPTIRTIFQAKLKKYKVLMMSRSVVTDISSHGVRVSQEGSEKLIKSDSIIQAGGMVKGGNLAQYLKENGTQVYEIGDCEQPARIKEAITEGYQVGRNI